MRQIEISGKVIKVATSAKDLTILQYAEFMQILSRRLEIPKNPDDMLPDGTYLTDTEYYTSQTEPADFKESRRLDALCYLTSNKVNATVLQEYPQLSNIIEGLLENFDVADYDGLITASGYQIDPIEKWTFQQWVDCENAYKQSWVYPFLVSSRRAIKTFKYDRSQPDWAARLSILGGLNAFDWVSAVRNLNSAINARKKAFPYIYTIQADGQPLGTYSKEYYDYAGWEDTIVSLSETGAFNSTKGTMHGVRTANAIDVLDYLNLKRGKDYSEYMDLKSKNKKL